MGHVALHLARDREPAVSVQRDCALLLPREENQLRSPTATAKSGLRRDNGSLCARARNSQAPRADSVQQALPSLPRLGRNRDASVAGRKAGGPRRARRRQPRRERSLSPGPAEQPGSRDDSLGGRSPRRSSQRTAPQPGPDTARGAKNLAQRSEK